MYARLIKIYIIATKGIKRKANNHLGRLGGIPACPNCGDRLLWKPMDYLLVRTGLPDSDPDGINICCECMENPNILDEARIEKHLEILEYSKNDIVIILCAISNLKKGLKLKLLP